MKDKDGTWIESEGKRKGVKVRVLTTPSATYVNKVVNQPIEKDKGIDLQKMKQVLLNKNMISDLSEIEGD